MPSDAEDHDEIFADGYDETGLGPESDPGDHSGYVMFHHYKIAVDLDVWDRMAKEKRERESVMDGDDKDFEAFFDTHYRTFRSGNTNDGLGVGERCLCELSAVLKMRLEAQLSEWWWHNVSAEASTMLLQETQFVANYNMRNCQKARKDWRLYLRWRERLSLLGDSRGTSDVTARFVEE